MDETKKMTFREWMGQLDNLVQQKVGLNLRDLPDQNYRAYYDEENTPADCFDFHVREELADLGFALEIEDLFSEAQELGFRKHAPHVLAEANLDYVTDEHFDLSDTDCDDATPF